MGEHTHKTADNSPEEAQAEFRRIIIDAGIVTAEQAAAVTFELVDPAEHPEIPRCACGVQ